MNIFEGREVKSTGYLDNYGFILNVGDIVIYNTDTKQEPFILDKKKANFGIVRFGEFTCDEILYHGYYIQWACGMFMPSLAQLTVGSRDEYTPHGIITKVGNIYENADLCQWYFLESLNWQGMGKVTKYYRTLRIALQGQ